MGLRAITCMLSVLACVPLIQDMEEAAVEEALLIGISKTGPPSGRELFGGPVGLWVTSLRVHFKIRELFMPFLTTIVIASVLVMGEVGPIDVMLNSTSRRGFEPTACSFRCSYVGVG